ncbi:MAG: substrate-binding domain-containing protein [Eubacteriales bacterium]|nr:substrate-binding domain-containing protein [Eubacteriales bacterium]
MITKKEKYLCAIYGLALIFLFLASSTDLIIKERAVEVYPVSVIIEGTSDENYVNFRKGMDQAAMELNADVSFITLYDENSRSQQIQLMEREKEDGVKAMIVMPVDADEIRAAVSQSLAAVPLVFLGDQSAAGQGGAGVTADYFSMGQQLAARILERHGTKLPVYLLQGETGNTVVSRFEAGISSELKARGCEAVPVVRDPEEGFRMFLEQLAEENGEPAVLAALDSQSLKAAADLLDGSRELSAAVAGLYGRGTSVQILNYLDEGVIAGLAVTDDFSAGYLSVKAAVEAAAGRQKKESLVLDSFYIEKEDLRSPEYEKMLYPIE